MKIIIEILPYLLLLAWLIYSIWILNKAKNKTEEVNPYIIEAIPQIFPTIGILGTFIGIAYGLSGFKMDAIKESIPQIVKGLSTAFYASIVGIVLSIVFSKFTYWRIWKDEQESESKETKSINKLIEVVQSLNNNVTDLLTSTDEENNKVKIGNVIKGLYDESRKQSRALQSFSTDLADTISAGFEKILNDENKGVLSELQQVKNEIKLLGNNLSDPTTEMTQNVVKDLELSMSKMIEEFKTSVSGSAKNELEGLAIILTKASQSLTTFPELLQQMTSNLNENFKGLQNVVDQISQKTLTQSENATDTMKKQIEEMSLILKSNVGELQTNQEVLINKQNESLTTSESLLKEFNLSIERMQGMSNGMNNSIDGFNSLQSELNRSASLLNDTSIRVNGSLDTLKSYQDKFSKENESYFNNNKEVNEAVLRVMQSAKDVTSDYVQKFSVIESGLQSIFAQIQQGLDGYTKTVGSSIETYLGAYSEALTETAKSLAGASAKQEEILEELTEQLSKLKSN